MLIIIRTIQLVVLSFVLVPSKRPGARVSLILLVIFTACLLMGMMLQKFLKPPSVMAKYIRSKHPGIFTTNLNWFARISEPSTVLSLNAPFCSRLVGFFPRILFCYAVLSNFDDILLMAEILHHLGCMKPVVNNGINYQPQLERFRRISAINSTMQISPLSQGNPSYPPPKATPPGIRGK